MFIKPLVYFLSLFPLTISHSLLTKIYYYICYIRGALLEELHTAN